MGEKEITLKERRIKDLEEYITLLESKGINKDDKEVIEDDLIPWSSTTTATEDKEVSSEEDEGEP